VDEFEFRIAGVPVLLSFAELDAAMRGQFEYEIVSIENRLVEIFNTRLAAKHDQRSYLGKMRVPDALAKFR